MSALPKEALRRGWCPSTLRPMATGDGWLVRLHPPGNALSPRQLGRVAELAQENGNGLVEISARGNLQLRGVTAETHPLLVQALLGEGLVDETESDGPQRVTLTSPLAGHDPSDLIDAAALAAAIEMRCRAIPGLPAKLGIAVDGGGRLPLEGFAADMRVVAVEPGTVAIGLACNSGIDFNPSSRPERSGAPGSIIGLGSLTMDPGAARLRRLSGMTEVGSEAGAGTWLGPVAVSDSASVVAGLTASFAASRSAAPEAVRHVRDLPASAIAALIEASGLPATTAPPGRHPPARAGIAALDQSRFAAMIGLPFGRSDAGTLARLAVAAGRTGVREIRTSPWRGLAFLDLARAEAEALVGLADEIGLITQDGDPRLSVQACAGAPACLRGQTPASRDAASLAEAAAPLLAAGLKLHVSGCVKSCANPGPADLTLVGHEGRYDTVFNGTTQDKPAGRLDLSQIVQRLQPGQDFHTRLTSGRVSGPKA